MKLDLAKGVWPCEGERCHEIQLHVIFGTIGGAVVLIIAVIVCVKSVLWRSAPSSTTTSSGSETESTNEEGLIAYNADSWKASQQRKHRRFQERARRILQVKSRRPSFLQEKLIFLRTMMGTKSVQFDPAMAMEAAKSKSKEAVKDKNAKRTSSGTDEVMTYEAALRRAVKQSRGYRYKSKVSPVPEQNEPPAKVLRKDSKSDNATAEIIKQSVEQAGKEKGVDKLEMKKRSTRKAHSKQGDSVQQESNILVEEGAEKIKPREIYSASKWGDRSNVIKEEPEKLDRKLASKKRTAKTVDSKYESFKQQSGDHKTIDPMISIREPKQQKKRGKVINQEKSKLKQEGSTGAQLPDIKTAKEKPRQRRSSKAESIKSSSSQTNAERKREKAKRLVLEDSTVPQHIIVQEERADEEDLESILMKEGGLAPNTGQGSLSNIQIKRSVGNYKLTDDETSAVMKHQVKEKDVKKQEDQDLSQLEVLIPIKQTITPQEEADVTTPAQAVEQERATSKRSQIARFKIELIKAKGDPRHRIVMKPINAPVFKLSEVPKMVVTSAQESRARSRAFPSQVQVNLGPAPVDNRKPLVILGPRMDTAARGWKKSDQKQGVKSSAAEGQKPTVEGEGFRSRLSLKELEIIEGAHATAGKIQSGSEVIFGASVAESRKSSLTPAVELSGRQSRRLSVMQAEVIKSLGVEIQQPSELGTIDISATELRKASMKSVDRHEVSTIKSRRLSIKLGEEADALAVDIQQSSTKHEVSTLNEIQKLPAPSVEEIPEQEVKPRKSSVVIVRNTDGSSYEILNALEVNDYELSHMSMIKRSVSVQRAAELHTSTAEVNDSSPMIVETADGSIFEIQKISNMPLEFVEVPGSRRPSLVDPTDQAEARRASEVMVESLKDRKEKNLAISLVEEKDNVNKGNKVSKNMNLLKAEFGEEPVVVNFCAQRSTSRSPQSCKTYDMTPGELAAVKSADEQSATKPSAVNVSQGVVSNFFPKDADMSLLLKPGGHLRPMRAEDLSKPLIFIGTTRNRMNIFEFSTDVDYLSDRSTKGQLSSLSTRSDSSSMAKENNDKLVEAESPPPEPMTRAEYIIKVRREKGCSIM